MGIELVCASFYYFKLLPSDDVIHVWLLGQVIPRKDTFSLNRHYVQAHFSAFASALHALLLFTRLAPPHCIQHERFQFSSWSTTPTPQATTSSSIFTVSHEPPPLAQWCGRGAQREWGWDCRTQQWHWSCTVFETWLGRQLNGRFSHSSQYKWGVL